jgi:hypothetical protein
VKPLSILRQVTASQLLGHPNFLPIEWRNFSRRAYVEPLLVEDGYHRWVLMSADDYVELQAVGDLMEGFSESDQMTIARFLMAMRDRAAREEAGENVTGQITAGAQPLGSPDIRIVAAGLAEMAKVGRPE